MSHPALRWRRHIAPRLLFIGLASVMAGCNRGDPTQAPTPGRAKTASEAAAELEQRGYSLITSDVDGKPEVVGIAITDAQLTHVLPGQYEAIERADVDRIALQRRLASLHLKRSAFYAIDPTTLAEMDGVRTLILEDVPLADCGLGALIGLPNVEEIEIRTSAVRATDSLLQALGRFPRLRRLDLTGIHDSAILPNQFYFLSRFDLESLALPDRFCTPELVGLWLAVHSRSGKARFGPPWQFSEAVLTRMAESLSTHPEIVTLELDGADLSPLSLSRLAGLNLHELALPKGLRTDATLPHWLAALDPGTRGGAWNFADWNLSDASLATIAALPGVVALDLTGTQITDEGVRHLAGMADLVELSLARTKITDAGLAHLAGCQRLRHLDLSETVVTQAGVAALPNLETLNWPGAPLATVRNMARPQFDAQPRVRKSDRIVQGLTEMQAAEQLRSRGFVLDFKPADDQQHIVKAAKPLNSDGQKQASTNATESEAELTEYDLRLMARLPRLEAIEVGWRKDIAFLPESVSALGSVTSLVLDGPEVPDCGLSRVRGLQNLESITIRSTGRQQPITDALCDSMMAFPKLRRVKLDELQKVSMTIDGLRKLATLSLEELDIPENLRSATAFELWLGVQPRARHLQIDGEWPLDDASLRLLTTFLDSRPDILTLEIHENLREETRLPELLRVLRGVQLLQFRIPQDLATDAGLPHWLAAIDIEAQGGDWNFAKWRIGDRGLEQIVQLPGVRSLDLSDTAVTDQGVALLVTATELEDLSLARLRITDVGVERLLQCKKLKLLDLSGTDVTDAGLALLSELPELQTLILRGCQLNGSGLKSFMISPLRELAYTIDDEKEELDSVCAIAGLEGLDLSGSALEDSDLEKIANLDALRRLDLSPLRRIDVGESQTNELLPTVSVDALPSWAVVRESRHAIGAEGFATVATMLRLETLNLCGCVLDDAGAKLLGKLPELRAIDVSSTHVREEGLHALLQAPKLERLNNVFSKTWQPPPPVHSKGMRGMLTHLESAVESYSLGPGSSDRHYLVVRGVRRPQLDLTTARRRAKE